MAKLVDNDLDLIRLLSRSKHDDQGWCQVSSYLSDHIRKASNREIFELNEREGSLYIRLTETGEVLKEWLT